MLKLSKIFCLSSMALILIAFLLMFWLIPTFSYAATWTFTITKQGVGDGDNYLMDNMLAEGFATTNYDDATNLNFGNVFGNEYAMVYGFPTISDSLELGGGTTYPGTPDSFKISFKVNTEAGADEDYGLHTYAIRTGHMPVENEATWTRYQIGDNWSTIGCWNTTDDIYATRESDGVHLDTLYIEGDNSAATWFEVWLNPDHVADEHWVIHVSYTETGTASPPTVYAADAFGNTNSPYLTVYGNDEGEEPAPSTRRRQAILRTSIEWPEVIDSALMVQYGFEFYDDLTAETDYVMYDEWDVAYDTGLIYVITPMKWYDVNRDNKVNILDMTRWIQRVYKGY